MNDQPNTITTALREAAALLEQHPHLEQPYITSSVNGTLTLSWYLHNGGTNETEQKATAAEIVRSINGQWDKATGDWSGSYGVAEFNQVRGLLRLNVVVDRPAVCERVVVGTEERTVPAVEARPERVETVEKVEWRCQPLLAEADTESAVA